MAQNEQILTISDEALEAISGIRSEEPDAEILALSLEIVGIRGNAFEYEMTFVPIEDVGPGDALYHHGDLPVVVPEGSIENLRGAGIQVSNAGLAIDNPNTPSPRIADPDTPPPDLSGPLEQRVLQIIESQINPAIAAHGGMAQLVAIEEGTAYVRLAGGCQGCGLAQVTLGQGIEVAITNAVPEVSRVVDVTDHDAGTNPYYEAAKK
ncbi:MAG: NifU family protein [Acidimicrobiia bacterium]